MIDVEHIKTKGAIGALKARIQTLRFYIVGGPMWNCYMDAGRFCKLEEVIGENRKILDEIEMLFWALRELEPENK